MQKQKIGIVGAGIVGLAHAWSAAQRGHEVTVFERSAKATGASVRNFGMVWPIGQPDDSRSIAMVARERWLHLSQHAGIWANPCGSIHLAHREDEWQVLGEFFERSHSGELGRHLRLLSPSECRERSSAIQPDGFLGGLFSDMELCVNPTAAVRAIPGWLQDSFGVRFEFGTPVLDVGSGWIRTASSTWKGLDRVVVCSGHDFETLFPDSFRTVGIRKCKLQMMRTMPQAGSWKLGPHLASGLTLRHYTSFRQCESLAALIARVSQETPELDKFGIHVMASQDNFGRVVLGDSHEYDSDIEPFDSELIDELILREIRKIIQIPSWSLESHWNGIYSKYPDGIVYEEEPLPWVHIATGLGGSGMTLAFGVAERSWEKWSEMT
jgi:FAD dependent oxidoreductase TIGR03364